jgi:hypothetical protein
VAAFRVELSYELASRWTSAQSKRGYLISCRGENSIGGSESVFLHHTPGVSCACFQFSDFVTKLDYGAHHAAYRWLGSELLKIRLMPLQDWWAWDSVFPDLPNKLHVERICMKKFSTHRGVAVPARSYLGEPSRFSLVPKLIPHSRNEQLTVDNEERSGL